MTNTVSMNQLRPRNTLENTAAGSGGFLNARILRMTHRRGRLPLPAESKKRRGAGIQGESPPRVLRLASSGGPVKFTARWHRPWPFPGRLSRRPSSCQHRAGPSSSPGWRWMTGRCVSVPTASPAPVRIAMGSNPTPGPAVFVDRAEETSPRCLHLRVGSPWGGIDPSVRIGPHAADDAFGVLAADDHQIDGVGRLPVLRGFVGTAFQIAW